MKKNFEKLIQELRHRGLATGVILGEHNGLYDVAADAIEELTDDVVRIITPKQENELLLCPFCGSTELFYEEYKHAAGIRYRILCGGCCACIDPGYAQDKASVAQLWNRRAEQ